MQDITIYTDGSYLSSRGQGGLALVMLENDKKIKEFSHGYKNTTNNQMEIGAIVIALRMIKEPCNSITIISDSLLAINQIQGLWKRNKNIALLKEADKQMKRVKKLCPKIEFKHVKGHQSDDSEHTKWNNYVDKLAVKASKAILE